MSRKYIFFAEEERASRRHVRLQIISLCTSSRNRNNPRNFASLLHPSDESREKFKKKCHCNNVIISFMSCIAFMIVCVVYFITRTTSTKSKQSSLRERYRIEFCFVVNFAVLLRLFVWKVITRPLSSFARSRRVEESKKIAENFCCVYFLPPSASFAMALIHKQIVSTHDT